ncbi:MAG TPA: hypothetical protein VK813_14150 [Edaphobacter sp.]|jgi:hypothetical protein|nr:hypothetical protein [Edaphobacter sp.]
MTRSLEYHILVRPLIPASLALFGMLLLASGSPAQNSTAVSSGHSVSATSTSTAHVSTNSGVTFSTRTPTSTTSPHNNNGRPQHTTANPLPYYYYPYVYAVPMPYDADVLDNGASDDNDPNYQGGPTVFDRRGAGPYSYIPPGYESPDEPTAAQTQAEDTPPAGYNPSPEPPQDPTVLVFKDGHQLEIGNYAIVNQTLYDLTPGHPRRIALADLDLAATQKQNDDHGVPFDLPSSQAN